MAWPTSGPGCEPRDRGVDTAVRNDGRHRTRKVRSGLPAPTRPHLPLQSGAHGSGLNPAAGKSVVGVFRRSLKDPPTNSLQAGIPDPPLMPR
jgi:hypothetical protein